MNVLMLSTDSSLLTEVSESLRRHQAYAARLAGLTIVVACHEPRDAEIRGHLAILPAAGRYRLIRWLRLLSTGWKASKLSPPSLISVQDPVYIGLAGWILAARLGLPLQVQVHEDIFNNSYREFSPGEWLRSRLARYILNRAAGIRAVSERIAGSIRAELKVSSVRIRVLPIFTDVVAIQKGSRDGKMSPRALRFRIRMASAGRLLERDKGWSTLIEAFLIVLAEIPDAGLVVFGDGPDRPEYERLIESKDLSDHLLLEGWKPDLGELLKSFDMYVQPSIREGWGRTMVEAAAAGLPLITTDVGLIGELFTSGEDAVVVPIGDSEALATAMIEVALSSTRQSELSAAATRALSRLPYRSFEDYCQAYIGALSACVDG